MKSFKILFFLIFIFFNSCTENETENSSNENYIEFKLGNQEYKATNGTHGSFNDWNFYDIEDKELKGVEHLNGFQIGIEDLNNVMYGEFVMAFQGLGYITNSILNTTCNNNVNLFYNVTIIRNDNIIGGIIEGTFSGKIGRPSSQPCFDCCHYIHNFSGKFRVIIK
jgi:hypothetical protein